MPGTSMWCSTRWRVEPALLLALGLLLTLTSALAHPQLPGSRLQGEATLRYFGFRVYHARLWTLPDFRASQSAEQPLVLELEYLRNLQGSAIAERSLKEMQRGGRFTDAQAQRWLAGMQRIFPDVKAGDRISGQHLPGQGARFWLNGRPAGQIDDADFARLFFGIWLSETTSEPDMRRVLLGQNDAGPRP
jgi:Chalcone isomerase-like